LVGVYAAQMHDVSKILEEKNMPIIQT